MNSKRIPSNCDETRSRRLFLKRFAILGAVVLAPAILGASGCQTMKNAFGGKDQPKRSKTVDDVLSEERPSW